MNRLNVFIGAVVSLVVVSLIVVSLAALSAGAVMAQTRDGPSPAPERVDRTQGTPVINRLNGSAVNHGPGVINRTPGVINRGTAVNRNPSVVNRSVHDGTEAGRLRISRRGCAHLVRHYPAAGVDLGGDFTISVPEVYQFDVTKDLQAYLDGPEETLEAERLTALAAAGSAGHGGTVSSGAPASTAADALALRAIETVRKSPGAELNAGTVRFNPKTGHLTFNGRPLTNPLEHALSVKCREVIKPENRGADLETPHPGLR